MDFFEFLNEINPSLEESDSVVIESHGADSVTIVAWIVPVGVVVIVAFSAGMIISSLHKYVPLM